MLQEAVISLLNTKSGDDYLSEKKDGDNLEIDKKIESIRSKVLDKLK